MLLAENIGSWDLNSAMRIIQSQGTQIERTFIQQAEKIHSKEKNQVCG